MSRLESAHESSAALGTGSTEADVALLLSANAAVLPSLQVAESDIAAAIDLVVDSLSAGGHLIYTGAGTSGWLAALDAAEVVVTFGMRDRVSSVVGGGLTLDPVAMTLGDDDVAALDSDPVVAACSAGDVVIAVSASGGTPFTVACVDRLRAAGALVVAIVNREDAPLAELADTTICVPVPGELVAGSTRLTAGMAQKIVLNTISTASMVRLGRVVNGQMVCVEPLNDKLRERIITAVSVAASVERGAAVEAMESADRGDVAVVMLRAGLTADQARERLIYANGNVLRACAG